jgi:hypothetical protein
MCNYRCVGKETPKPFTDYEFIVPQHKGTTCPKCNYYKEGMFFTACPNCHLDLMESVVLKPKEETIFNSTMGYFTPKEETVLNSTVGYFTQDNRFISMRGVIPSEYFTRVPEEPRIGDFLGIDNQPIKINTENKSKRIFKIDDKYTQLLNELVEFTSLIDGDCDASEIWTSLGTLLQRHGRAAKLNEIYLEDDDDE